MSLGMPTRMMVHLVADEWIEIRQVSTWTPADGYAGRRIRNEGEVALVIEGTYGLSGYDIEAEFANGHGAIDTFKASALNCVMSEVQWGDVIDTLERAYAKASDTRDQDEANCSEHDLDDFSQYFFDAVALEVPMPNA